MWSLWVTHRLLYLNKRRQRRAFKWACAVPRCARRRVRYNALAATESYFVHAGMHNVLHSITGCTVTCLLPPPAEALWRIQPTGRKQQLQLIAFPFVFEGFKVLYYILVRSRTSGTYTYVRIVSGGPSEVMAAVYRRDSICSRTRSTDRDLSRPALKNSQEWSGWRLLEYNLISATISLLAYGKCAVMIKSHV